MTNKKFKIKLNGKPVYNKYYTNRKMIQVLTVEANEPRVVSGTALMGETVILYKVTQDTGISHVLTESFGEGNARR